MGRFDFVSPGAMAGSAIQEELVRRQMMERQAMLDEQRRQEAEADRAARQQQLMLNAEEQNLRRQQMTQTAAERAAAAERQRQLDARAASKAANEYGVRQMIGEAINQGPMTPESARQIASMAYREDMEMPGIVAKALETPKPPTPAAVGSFEDFVTRFAGPNPTPEQVIEARRRWEAANDRAGGGGEASPYFIPSQTGEGFRPFNTRTGEFGPVTAPLKPGETAQQQIANAQTILWTMANIERDLTPEKIGPIAGRFKSVQEAITGGDPAFSALSAQVSQLQNTVINLRTGAAMGEKEAARILSEIPDVNLPPATFMARLGVARGLYQEWLRNRSALAFGTGATPPIGMPGQTPPPVNQPAPGPATTPSTTPTETPEQRKARLKNYLPPR